MAVHKCFHPYCDTTVPITMFGCRQHWFSLPKELRDEIWAAYLAWANEEAPLELLRAVQARAVALVKVRDLTEQVRSRLTGFAKKAGLR